MNEALVIYNTLTRKKELFKPITPHHVGMYVCGPTVYSDVHLGNCRTFISFDLIYRYLLCLGYKVRYIRNITDAGHLESDADVGEDKIAKRAKLEQLEPMEIVHSYTYNFQRIMENFNVLLPSIEPTATGHIIEQIEMTKTIIEQGYAYAVNGSVYFDVEKYSKENNYGQLSNRKLEDLLSNTRELEGQNEKKGKLDFALWINAKPEHIMKWTSPWGFGFPGWHIECSAMSAKYLGNKFDIHGGGMDLIPTHHTNEIAQSQACNHTEPANYWIHTNMLTVNGQKMGKSLGNSFLPEELFSGKHELLDKGYSPMVVRFFMLQSHYRSTLDFSNEALSASEKGYARLMNALKTLEKIKPSDKSDSNIKSLKQKCYDAMNDDFNSPVAIAYLFEGVKIINSIEAGKEKISKEDLSILKEIFRVFVETVFGLKPEEKIADRDDNQLINEVMKAVINIRAQVKAKKDFSTSDLIRDELAKVNISIKDSKEGASWSHEE